MSLQYTRPELELKRHVPMAGGRPGSHEFVRAATVMVGFDDTCDFVCDGISDDVQINAAGVYVNAFGGGTVHVAVCPTGVPYYDITALILVYTNEVLEGEGYRSYLRLADDSNISAISNADRVAGNTNIVIKDLRIDANAAGQASYGRPIDFINVDSSRVLFNWCLNGHEGPAGTRGMGISLQLSEYNTIMGNTCTGNGHDGIGLRNASYYNIIEGNQCRLNGYHGIQCAHIGEASVESQHNLIVGNTCEANDQTGIICDTSSFNVITGNLCYNNPGQAGIYALFSADVVISGNECIGNHVGIISEDVLSLRTIIVGNNCRSSVDAGIGLYDSIYANVSGNTCTSNGLQGIYVAGSYHVIGNNICVNNGQTAGRPGIRLYASSYCVVTGNICTDDQGVKTQTYGIAEEAAADYNFISGNDVRGNLYAGIPTTGSHTFIEDSPNAGLRFLYWQSLFESVDGFLTTSVGASTVNLTYQRARLTTGATTNNSQTVAKEPLFSHITFSWSKRHRVMTVIRPGQITNQEIWAVVGQPTGVTRRVGFKILNNTLYATVSDGTTESTINCGAVVALSSYILDWVFQPDAPTPEARFWVDGVAQGALTTNLPTGATSADQIMYLFIRTTADAAKQVDFSIWELWHERNYP